MRGCPGKTVSRDVLAGSTGSMNGRLMIANPADVAAADQAAAALGRDVTVSLTELVPAGEAYVVDRHVLFGEPFDEVTRLLGDAESG